MQTKILKISFFLIVFLMLPNFARAGTTNITTCQNLNIANETYVLQNDVASDGTCFTISAQHVILDLNGHTVTYDNAVKLTVPNGSYESADMSDWDLSNAPNASRVAGTFVQPVSVYDGDYAVRVALPAADQYIESTNSVTLEANTTYSLSAMFRNSGNNDVDPNASNTNRESVVMSVEIAGTAYKATKTGMTWRGFEYTNNVFTTGSSPVTGKIKISFANMTTAGIKGYVAVDDIRILRANSYGVNIGQFAHYYTLTNGTIQQGQGDGFASHVVNGVGSWLEYNINNLTMTSQGVNSKAIYAYAALNCSMHDLTINHNVRTIKNRDQYDGAAIHINYSNNANNYGSELYNITIPTGVQTGISMGHENGKPPHLIHDNNITLQSRYTNDFAITAGGSEVYRNTVNCSGNNSCRGIIISGVGTKVFNNIVTVQDAKRNQEYNGCEGEPNGGTYGMQGEYIATGCEVYGNTVTAIADSCAANVLRLNPDANQPSYAINIHDNTFIATAIGTAAAYPMRFASLSAQPALLIHNNIFRTNSMWVFHDYTVHPSEDVTLTDNTFEISGPLVSPYSSPFLSSGGSVTYTFNNNIYGPGAQDSFENKCFRSRYNTSICAAGENIIFASTTDAVAPAAPSGLSVM